MALATKQDELFRRLKAHLHPGDRASGQMARLERGRLFLHIIRIEKI
ncbi:hypothetical protein QM565_13105 [Geitlerinema splendidum]|nr:hypothetical protein [Geitlerinema splendidum]